MRLPAPDHPLRSEHVPAVLSGFGLALGVVLATEVAVFTGFSLRPLRDVAFVVGLLTSIPFVAGLAYAGRWLARSELSPARYPRVALWTAGCCAGFFLLNLAMVLTFPAESAAQGFSWLRWAASVGACGGVAVGVVEARAIEEAIAAERARVRSEHVARQRDTLDYLNSVLRHEILNASTAISGYASRVLSEEDLDPEARRWLGIVVEESEDMSRVIDDVRVLLRRTTDDDHEPEPTALAPVLEDELRELTYLYEDVRVEASIPEDLAVLADGTLPRVFGNLLANAVEHNDAAEPHVRVDVEPGPDVVRVEVADDGPGVPEEQRDSLWDRDTSRNDSHGLGLYLVRELVESYGGDVELVETGPSGSRFAVELPRADAEQDGDAAERDAEATAPDADGSAADAEREEVPVGPGAAGADE